MLYNLPSNNLYNNEPEIISFPDHWKVTISAISGAETPQLSREKIKEKILSPIGTSPIREGACHKKSAVIIIDDITRPTPAKDIAEVVLDELSEAGVPKDNIWFVAALGAHGCMYRNDFILKLGSEIVSEYPVFNHTAFMNTTYLGKTAGGIPVEINSDVMSADYKIAIGTMMPHSLFGFSGGAKSVLPGISSINTIKANHSMTSPFEFNMGNSETKVREEAESACDMVGLDFKIDVILNGRGNICELFCGDFREEAAKARIYASKHYFAAFVPDQDIVISNNYLKPLEANCAYTPETIASLKPGGDYVLSANSPFGTCVHYLYDSWGKSKPGGMLWAGLFQPDSKMKNLICYSKYTAKGMRESWFVDEVDKVKYISEWDTVIRKLDDGRPKNVVVYPMAECQILDISSKFYT